MKYYKVELSHYCSCKVVLDDSEDIDQIVKNWLRWHNAGEMKSDRLILKGIIPVTEQEYKDCRLPGYQIKSFVLNKQK